MEPGVDDEGADPGSWGHVSCCCHWQPLLVLVAPTVHHLSKHSAVCGSLHCFGAFYFASRILSLGCAGSRRVSGVLGLETNYHSLIIPVSTRIGVGEPRSQEPKTTTLQHPRCFASPDLGILGISQSHRLISANK